MPPKLHPKEGFRLGEEGIKNQTTEKNTEGLYFNPFIKVLDIFSNTLIEDITVVNAKSRLIPIARSNYLN